MDGYYIQYHSRTQVALVQRDKQQTSPLPSWVFDFPADQLKIGLVDGIKKIDNTNLHTGLNVIASSKAMSVEQAKKTSEIVVETILNFISFSTLTYCNPAKLLSEINIADKEACPSRYYVYPFDEQEIIGSLSIIDEPTFRALFEAYTKSSHQQRILRALTWLRKGIGEENTVDEFICYWIGWEVIRGILRRNLRYQVKNPGRWDGIKVILTDKLSFQNFDAIEKARERLFHAGRQEDRLDNKFIVEIESYLEPLRKTLIFCIGSILELEDNTILTIANKTLRRIRQNPWSVIEGVLQNIPRDFDELVKNYPVIEAEIANKKFLIDERGELSITFSITYRFLGPSGANLEVKATEFWGDKDAGIKHMNLTDRV